jgi:hypothetical protein
VGLDDSVPPLPVTTPFQRVPAMEMAGLKSPPFSTHALSLEGGTGRYAGTSRRRLGFFCTPGVPRPPMGLAPLKSGLAALKVAEIRSLR